MADKHRRVEIQECWEVPLGYQIVGCGSKTAQLDDIGYKIEDVTCIGCLEEWLIECVYSIKNLEIRKNLLINQISAVENKPPVA